MTKFSPSKAVIAVLFSACLFSLAVAELMLYLLEGISVGLRWLTRVESSRSEIQFAAETLGLINENHACGKRQMDTPSPINPTITTTAPPKRKTTLHTQALVCTQKKTQMHTRQADKRISLMFARLLFAYPCNDTTN